MNKDLIAVFEYLEREKGIKREIVIHAIEESLQAAARKNISGASNVTVTIHPRTGNIDVYCEKEIVDEVEVPAQEISLQDAQILDPDAEMGQFIDILVTPKDFGRIAAEKARQVITQKLRMAEKDVIHEEYRHRISELVSGTVKRFVKGANLIIDLGKVEGMMPMREYPKTEKYQIGDKVLALLMEVRETENGGAEVILSRNHPDFIKTLLSQEVPEITDGTIEVMAIVRDPGYRTKICVRSNDLKVDPVGSCVGMRGTRIKNIIRELNNEKIDVIPYAKDPLELLQNTLNPIEIKKVSVNEDEETISIVVEDDNFAAVIGKKGMNARLNGDLIGYHLEVQRMSDYKRSLELERLQMAESKDASLDEKIQSFDGISKLIVQQLLASEELDTKRKILLAPRETLLAISGMNNDTVDKILEQIRKQRV